MMSILEAHACIAVCDEHYMYIYHKAQDNNVHNIKSKALRKENELRCGNRLRHKASRCSRLCRKSAERTCSFVYN